ncbi:hypothetical protein RQP46_000203 [Phenoliferia psychrophenolica]
MFSFYDTLWALLKFCVLSLVGIIVFFFALACEHHLACKRAGHFVPYRRASQWFRRPAEDIIDWGPENNWNPNLVAGRYPVPEDGSTRTLTTGYPVPDTFPRFAGPWRHGPVQPASALASGHLPVYLAATHFKAVDARNEKRDARNKELDKEGEKEMKARQERDEWERKSALRWAPSKKVAPQCQSQPTPEVDDSDIWDQYLWPGAPPSPAEAPQTVVTSSSSDLVTAGEIDTPPSTSQPEPTPTSQPEPTPTPIEWWVPTPDDDNAPKQTLSESDWIINKTQRLTDFVSRPFTPTKYASTWPENGFPVGGGYSSPSLFPNFLKPTINKRTLENSFSALEVDDSERPSKRVCAAPLPTTPSPPPSHSAHYGSTPSPPSSYYNYYPATISTTSTPPAQTTSQRNPVAGAKV